MLESKRFGLDVVLSIYPGRLVAKNHMDDVYAILNWMTNDNLYTHQLPRALRECEPWLLKWFPELEQALNLSSKLDVYLKNESDPAIACAQWVGELKSLGLPESFDVPRLPPEAHEQKEPLAELRDMAGPDKPIIVI